MKRRVFLMLLSVAIVTASVGAYFRTSGADQAPAYATVPVIRGSVIETVAATGTLETVETVAVGTQVSGTIASLHADFNSSVRAGQIIARIEPSLFDSQVRQAEASLARVLADVERARIQLEDASVNLRRSRELWEQQLIPRVDVETAESNARTAEASLKAAQAQVAQARASLHQAQVTLSHTVVKAPIDGIVVSRSVEVGQTVAASMSAPTLFVIAKDLAQMQVNARVDEADIGRIAPGQPATFTVDAYPGRTFSATVSQVRLEPMIESNVVSYVTILGVPNPDLALKPGMTANVTIEVARADDVLRVPSSALRFRPPVAGSGGAPARTPPATRPAPGPTGGGAEVSRVWVLNEGQLRPVRVTTAISDGSTTAVTDGELSVGDLVVTGIATPQAAERSGNGSPLVPFGGRRSGGGASRGGAPGGGAGQGVRP